MPQESPRPKYESAEWNRTQRVGERLAGSPDYTPPRAGDKRAPYGFYAGRPIIGSGMDRIIGGVYLGAQSREALVVDDAIGTPSGEFMRSFYSATLLPQIKKAAQALRLSPQDVAPYQAFLAVMQTMPFDLDKTNRLVSQVAHGRHDQKVHIATFLTHQTGVCRHQVLMVAYLLEKLMREQDPALRLDGTFSLERNQVALYDENRVGAHVWVRYTDGQDRVWIIDTAQNKFGLLEDLVKRPDCWEYARPEDLKRLRK